MLDESPGAARRLPIRFVGSGSEYFRIWIVNLLLTLVTIGLYYPFAKVRRLRYFHGATEVGGHPLSFHADPWKMLRGYILVAVMVALYSIAGQFSTTAGLIAFVIVAAIWPALWHSSLVFRLANTGWRGLRFRFTGTRNEAYRVLAPALVAALLVIGLTGFFQPQPGAKPDASFFAVSLMPLVVMLALPWLLWRMRRYQHDHYALGAENTRFSLPLSKYYRVFFFATLMLFLFAAVVGGVVAVLAIAGVGRGQKLGGAGWFAMSAGILVLYVLLLSLIGAYVGARLQNMTWNRTESRRISFDSRLEVGALLGLSIRNWLLIVLTLGLYFPFAAIATAKLRLESVAVLSTVDPDEFAAAAQQFDEAAAGDAAGDLFGFDIGL